jgi:hypothetical protein
MANTTGRKPKDKPSSERKTVSIKRTRKSTTKKEKNLKKKGKEAGGVTVDLSSGSEGDVPKEVEIEYVP